MNILVTGGGGSLGSRLLIPLIRRGDRVVLFDLRHPTRAGPEKYEQLARVQGDLADRASVFETIGSHAIEIIFHLGAILSSEAEDRLDLAWKTNMEGTFNVLDAARKFGVKKFIFSSTVATYGKGIPDPLPLDAPQWPFGLYGVTKVAGERLGFYFHHRFGLDFRGVRLPAVVAPSGATGGASAYCSAVFGHSVRYGRYEFYLNRTTRAPMLYIADALEALIKLSDAPPEALTQRVYNIAGIEPSAEEMAAAILRQLPHVKFSYRPDPLRTKMVESWPRRIDDADAKRDWGWVSRFDLETMTREILEAIKRETAS